MIKAFYDPTDYSIFLNDLLNKLFENDACIYELQKINENKYNLYVNNNMFIFQCGSKKIILSDVLGNDIYILFSKDIEYKKIKQLINNKLIISKIFAKTINKLLNTDIKFNKSFNVYIKYHDEVNSQYSFIAKYKNHTYCIIFNTLEQIEDVQLLDEISLIISYKEIDIIEQMLEIKKDINYIWEKLHTDEKE